MLRGLSAEQLRSALQEPRTANYLRRQLEAETAFAAKLQLQQQQQQQTQVVMRPPLVCPNSSSRHCRCKGVDAPSSTHRCMKRTMLPAGKPSLRTLQSHAGERYAGMEEPFKEMLREVIHPREASVREQP